MIRIQLSSVKKQRNQQEWRWLGVASARGLESVGDGNNIKLLARKLIEAGHSGPCEVFRGEMPVFGPLSLEKWAEGKALTGEQPEHLKREGRQ